MKILYVIIILSVSIFFTNIVNAQWVENPGPYGGFIPGITASGSNLYAVTNGEIFNSTDDGSNWRLLNFPRKLFPTVAVTGTKLFAFTYRDGLYVSTDNGSSWSQVNTTFNLGQFGVPVLVSGKNLFAGTSKGVFLSSDSGVTFSPTNNSILQSSEISALEQNGANLFVGTSKNGAFFSGDNGASWTQVNTGLTNLNVHSFAFIGANTFAGTDSSVFVSANNGTNWSSANKGLPIGSANIVAVGSNLIATTTSGVFLSADNGTSWQSMSTMPMGDRLTLSGSKIFAIKGGVYCSSDNGANWKNASTGINRMGISTMVTSGSNIFVDGDGVLLRSQDNAVTWQLVYSGFSPVVSGGSLFATPTKGVFRSTDDGSSWSPAGLSDNLISSIFVYGTNLLASTHSADWASFETFISKDNGTSWAVPNGMSTQLVNSSASLGSYLFAGTYYNGVYRSSDNGNNWEPVNDGLQAGTIYSLGTSGTHLYAGVGYGSRATIYESPDNGTNWNDITNNLFPGYVMQIVSSGTNLFVGCDNGVFYSTDNGANWTDANNGFGSDRPDIYQLSIIGSELFAGTSSRGLWRRPLSEFGSNGVSESDARFDVITLSPNPTSGLTTINYTLTEPGVVSLTLSNSLGIEIAKISNNQIQERGNYSFNYDANNLAPGIYFLTIKAGNNTETKKFVVIR